MNFNLLILACWITLLIGHFDTLQSWEHRKDLFIFLKSFFSLNVISCFLLAQLKDRDEKLGEAGELQRFLGNLDHFQQWLSRTQTTVASEDAPNSLSDAERLLNQHQQLKDEIDAYMPEYAKMKDFGDHVTEGQSDPQYMFLAQRLSALDDGWKELLQMWESRQQGLSQDLNLQVHI